MNKQILFGLIVLITFTYGQMIGSIAMIIEGEAVTTAEIETLRQSKKVSKQKAIEILILDRLQKVAIKKISISEDQIDTKVADIVLKNNISVQQMQKLLKKQGNSWKKYRSTIRDTLKKEKFYKNAITDFIPKPSQDELKIFYKNHKKEFAIPSHIKMIEYSTEDEEGMQTFLRTKKRRGVKSHTVIKETEILDPVLLSILLKTKSNTYTHPLNAGNRYVVFKVLSKMGQVILPFNVVKPTVLKRWREQQKDKALKEYLEKMRAGANIQTIR